MSLANSIHEMLLPYDALNTLLARETMQDETALIFEVACVDAPAHVSETVVGLAPTGSRGYGVLGKVGVAPTLQGACLDKHW